MSSAGARPRGPRNRPSTPASLTSPMPIPRGYASAASRKNPPAAAAGDSCSGSPSMSSSGPEPTTATTAAGSVILFGISRVSRSMSASGTRKHDQREPEREARRVVVVDGDDSGEEQAGGRLDGRVAARDRLAAVAAAPAQQQPRDDRDVVVRADRVLARRAARAGLDERLAARQPPRDDVEERADEEAAERGDDEDEEHGGGAEARRGCGAPRDRAGVSAPAPAR